ncbi:MAG: CHRD domain-containing protein [Gaiellaceae bacterium]
MRRYGALFVVALVALAGYSAQAATSAHKTVICHATSSAKKPYKRIVTANRAIIRAHTLGHHGDIVNPAGSVCPSQPLSFSRGGRPISATLTPVAPNTLGSGTFVARSNVGQGRICWSLTVTGLAGVTASHIHYGTGPNATQIAVPLALPTPFTGTARGCSDAPRALVKQILTKPSGFYVNVHTTTYPAGAIKGTLKKGAKH